MNDNGREPPRNLDDGDLAAKVAAGDAAAFGLLYDRYAGAVYALSVHLLGTAEAEEAVQEVFLSLWRKAHQFDATRGSFAAWFMSIARHRALRALRARDRHWRIQAPEEIDQLLAHAPDETVDVEEQAWQQDLGRVALSALSRLPAEQRQVIVLAYFGGLSQSAIAQQLDLPLGTVKKRVRLGMQKLRLAIGEQLRVEYQMDRRDDSISPRHG